MNLDKVIREEIYKMMRTLDDSINAVELAKIVDTEMSYEFDLDKKKIRIFGHGYDVIYGWDENKGLISLEDEDRDFDEKFQEGEA